VTLAAGPLEATFLPDLGMLGVSLRHGGQEFLALPGGLAAYLGRGTNGIPLLAPWANRLRGWRYRAAGVSVDLAGIDLPTDPNGLPIHGEMLGVRGWRLAQLETAIDRASLRASFDFGSRPDLLAAFPFPHLIEIEAAVEGASSSLTILTTLRPSARRRVPVSFGYHPYFRLPGTGRPSWRLELPSRRRVVLDERGLPTGARQREAPEDRPFSGRTFDDLYALGRERRLAIADRRHRLMVRFGHGYPYGQVYAPPGRNFVCLEPMTAPTDALSTGAHPVMGPGETFTARFTVAIEALGPSEIKESTG